MLKKLNIEIKYSASYRPESQGLLERQHRDVKTSIKASLEDLKLRSTMEDMANKFQNKWLDQLPWVLLGKRVTLQTDLGASPCELAMGLNVRIPGQILREPGDLPDSETLKELLHQVRVNTNNPPIPTSNHRGPEPKLPPIPEGISHVYTKQHNVTGLQVPYEGPFKVDSWPTKSTVKIEVGIYKSGEKRYEIRHVNDLKIAHPESLAAPASRPKLGRPPRPRTTSSSGGQPSTDETSPESTPSNRFPNPPSTENKTNSSTGRVGQVGNSNSLDHATSILEKPALTSTANEDFEGAITGPPPAPAFTRAARSTRNPHPRYVDSFWLASALHS